MQRILLLSMFTWVLYGCPGPQPLDPIPVGGLRLEGVRCFLRADQDQMAANQPHKSIMFDTISNELSQYLTLVADSREADLDIYLWLTTDQRVDEAIGEPCWFATIGTRAVRRQNAQVYWRFQCTVGDRVGNYIVKPGCAGDSDVSHQVAVENTAKGVAKKIIQDVQLSSGVPDRDTYELRFAGFDPGQRDKIKETMAQLGSGSKPYLVLEPGGRGSGGVASYRIRWLRGSSQEEVKQIIEETAGTNGLNVRCSNSSPGILVFEPGAEE